MFAPEPSLMRRILKASLLMIAALTALSSCTTSHIEQRVYPAATDSPVIDFSHGGAWSPQFRYTVNGVQACREVCRPKTDSRTHITSYPIAQQQEVTPTTEQWQAFWKRARPLRLSEWRKTYNSKDIGDQVCDGTQWFLRYSVHGSERTSSGDNGYPVIGRPEAGTLSSKSFDELLAAFDTLFPTTMMQFAGYD